MSHRAKALALRMWGGPPGDLPAAFWWLWGGTFVARIANFVVPFSSLYFTMDRGISDSVAGSLVGLYGLGTVGGSLAGGITADLFGSKRTLIVGYSAAGIATLALGLTSGTFVLCGVMLLVGVFGGATRPATNALTAELVPEKSRVRVFALNYWAMNVGFAVACLSAGLLASLGYATLFCIDGATTLACAVVVLLGVPKVPTRLRREVRPAPEHREEWPAGRKASWLGPVRDPVFAAVFALSVVTAALLQQLTVTLPLAMRASGFSVVEYGLVAALNGTLVCVLQMPISSLITRKPLVFSLALGSALLGLGLGLTAFATSVLGYVLTLVIWTLGEIVAAPAAPALAARLASGDDQGRYQGALSAAWGIGAIFGPAAGTWLFAQGGNKLLWGACAVAGVVAAVGYLLLSSPVGIRLAAADSTIPITADDHIQETTEPARR
jgi:MFS family permease